MRVVGALLLVLCAGPLAPPRAARAEGWWAQAMRAATFWSGPDGAAVSFGELPRGTYFFVADPQPSSGQGRLYVRQGADGAFGYVDTVALAPSNPPPSPDATAAPGTPGTPGPQLGAPLFQPYWAASTRPATLWAATGPGGAAAGEVPEGAKLLVLAPPAGERLYVQDARTERLGYVEAGAVATSTPPGPDDLEPAASPAPPVPTFRPWWVTAIRPADLWSAIQGGTSFGRVVPGDAFLVMSPQDGPRLHVLNPKTKNYAYLDAASVGPTGAPRAAAVEVRGWQGTVAAEVVNLRTEPNTYIGAAGQARAGDLVTVSAWLEGEELDKDSRTWARVTSVRRKGPGGEWQDVALGEPAGDRYVYAGLLRPLPITQAPPAPQTSLGDGGARWIDVNITQQTVTAYEGSRPVHVAPATSGRPGWHTPTGIFRIQRRVENETMVGSTLLRLDSQEVPDYHLENVKWTQYFTSNGAAIHTNYWRPVGLFGMPSSHGCLGMTEEHARWFWNWARVGTPLLVHI
jgi:lipoprotein-anchoring transpeptidase ErfK/SrfK